MAQSLVAQPLGFPAVWLRHNCPCPDCRDPVTGQRLVEITQVSNVSVATVTAECGDSLEVTFTPGGHRSVFSRAWLAALLIDGFAAAAALRAADPVSFGVLTATPIPFSYVDKATSLTACQPLIALSADGRIACIRLNNRSLQPLRLPFGQAEAVYAATDRDNSKKQFASPCDRVSASRRLGVSARPQDRGSLHTPPCTQRSTILVSPRVTQDNSKKRCWFSNVFEDWVSLAAIFDVKDTQSPSEPS